MELPDRLTDRYQCHRDRKLDCIKRRAGTGVWLSALSILLMLVGVQIKQKPYVRTQSLCSMRMLRKAIP